MVFPWVHRVVDLDYRMGLDLVPANWDRRKEKDLVSDWRREL